MKKLFAIAQLIIGVIVLLYAFSMFWHALSHIFVSLKNIVTASDFPSYMSITPFNQWLQLILAVFIIYVVAVYTKKLFDKLSVSN